MLLASAYLAMAFRLPFGQMDRPGAAIFPVIVGAIFALGSFAAVLEGWNMDRAERVDLPSDDGVKQIAGLLASLFAYFMLLPWLGQLLASFLFCMALMRMLSNVSWPRIISYSALLSAAVYVVFIELLKVPMPRGILAP